MPGTLNVGGHDIITHSGTSGAGTINLVDQAGNTILTDSGSGMSLSSNVTFPAGHVIQTVSYQNVSASVTGNVTSTNTPTTILTIVVNNVLESSIIVGTVSTGMLLLNSGQYIYTEILGGGITTTHTFYSAAPSGTNTRWSQAFIFLDPSPATGTNTYYVKAYSNGSGNAAYWCGANLSHGYTIFEIAQ